MYSVISIWSIKTSLAVVVFCLLNSYLIKCDYSNKHTGNNLQSNTHPEGLSAESDMKSEDFALGQDESDESDVIEHNNIDYLAKLKILELFLNDLKRKELLSSGSSSLSAAKRGFKRNLFSGRSTHKDSEKKRPGWELAYGRRKRATF